MLSPNVLTRSRVGVALYKTESLERLDGGRATAGGLRFDLDSPDGDGAAASRGVAIWNLDFTSAELPRIFRALKGLIRCISSFSNSYVDLPT